MVTDWLSDVEVRNADALRHRFARDRSSADIFNGFTSLVALVFGAADVVLAFGDPAAPWLEFRYDGDLAHGSSIATAALVSHSGEHLGELRVVDRSPRFLDLEQRSLLVKVATLVVDNYEARIGILREREIERYRLDVLKLAANGAPQQQIFDALVEAVQYSVAGSICTIMLIVDGRLYRAAAGRALPASYMAEIEGLKIGQRNGSCGSAAFLADTVVVTDIKNDPLWEGYTAAAAAAGVESCWSTPIVLSGKDVLGTLGVYRRDTTEPTPEDLAFTHEAAHIAAIAIEAGNARVRLEQMALHDSLTKLPNRTLFENRMDQAIASARRTGRSVAIGLMDLNRFKVINDSLGHSIGDQLLTDVAGRLLNVVRSQDTVARMGGDEFLLLMADLENRDAARLIAERFVSMLDPSFTPNGNEIFVKGSMGVSMYPDDSREPSELLRLADSAMYVAKAGGDSVAFYNGTAHNHSYSSSRLDIESSLYGALENGEFEMLFQPQIDVSSGAIVSAEALLRWRHARFGIMPPDRFISIAEDTGLTVAIGGWVLEEACRFGRRWADAGGPGAVWVNVSPRQIEDPRFVESVLGALESSGLAPSKLWLEITENLIMRMPEGAGAKLTELRRAGVRSAIDDYGSGHSSLSFLKRLPIGAIKIDPELLRDVGRKAAAADEAIVRAILGVGRSLRMKIVAEGIETREQYDFLCKNGCALAQGFYFARPLPPDDLLRWEPPR